MQHDPETHYIICPIIDCNVIPRWQFTNSQNKPFVEPKVKEKVEKSYDNQVGDRCGVEHDCHEEGEVFSELEWQLEVPSFINVIHLNLQNSRFGQNCSLPDI